MCRPLARAYFDQQLNLAKTAPYNYIHGDPEKIFRILQPIE